MTADELPEVVVSLAEAESMLDMLDDPQAEIDLDSALAPLRQGDAEKVQIALTVNKN